MPELRARLPCPVCLGTTMEKVALRSGGLEVDFCRRCGGIWLEQGEVQGLRKVPQTDLWRQIEKRKTASPTLCHDCHAPLDRTAERCESCGWSAVLDCPDCDRPMRVESYSGLRLDVCRTCRGVWFDHHEVEAIWGATFDRALRQRKLPAKAVGELGEVGGEVLLHSLFFAPDLVFYGARAAGSAMSASADALASLPAGLAATPEVAATAFEAVGDAAGGVFDIVVEIIAGIFDAF